MDMDYFCIYVIYQYLDVPFLQSFWTCGRSDVKIGLFFLKSECIIMTELDSNRVGDSFQQEASNKLDFHRVFNTYINIINTIISHLPPHQNHPLHPCHTISSLPHPDPHPFEHRNTAVLLPHAPVSASQ